MRSTILLAALAAGLAMSGGAFAATSTTGLVKSFDMKAHTLTLDNGIVYKLPATFKDPGLKLGEKVAVDWSMQGSDHDASSVTIVR